MRLYAVTTPAAGAELVADRLWQAGAAGIWEGDAPGGAVVLRAGVDEADVEAFLAGVADLSPVDVTDAERVELATRTVEIGAGGLRATLEVPPTVFGDGLHPTTAACLELVAARVGPGVRFLDVGCGSGALSVVAALAGASVVAIDVDAVAVEATLGNAARNGVVLEASTAPLAAVGATFDVVAANISARAVLELAGDLRRFCAPGGVIVPSGILAERWAEVRSGLGGEVLEVREVDGWVSAVVRP
ncbi:MAG: 50S ribosomal protein L11 methyltransferase [Acidimicrobiia bacterium]